MPSCNPLICPTAECVGMARVCSGRWPILGHSTARDLPAALPSISSVSTLPSIPPFLGRHSLASPAPFSSDSRHYCSSAEPLSSRGSLSRLASPAWTDFRVHSRQPTLSRTSSVSRELLNHFPSRGMSSSTAPELLSAQGHGPTTISAGSVH